MITARPRHEEDGMSDRRGADPDAHIFRPFMREVVPGGLSASRAGQSHDDAQGGQSPTQTSLSLRVLRNCSMGIGLNVFKPLLELHRGTVQVFSAAPGLGGTFTVRLPRHP